MKNRGSLVTLLAIITAVMPTVHADQVVAGPSERPAPVPHTVASVKNASATRYFEQETNLSEEQLNFTLSVPAVGFIRATDKDMVSCRYNHIDGRSKLTKFEKVKGENETGLNLAPVKTEEFILTFDLKAFCKRKGMNGRKSTPMGEFVARRLRATTNPTDMDCSTFVDLYQNCIPTWLQADNAANVTEFITHLEEDLTHNMIDPNAIDAKVRPVLVITIKDDLFLQSIDTKTWNKVKRIFNVSTFRDAKIRKLFFDAKNHLVEAREVANDTLDLNPSLMEGIFADIEKESAYFSKNSMIRKIIQKTMNGVWTYGVPAAVVSVIMYGIYKGSQKACHSSVLDAQHAADVTAAKGAVGELRTAYWAANPQGSVQGCASHITANLAANHRAALEEGVVARRWRGFRANFAS